MSNFKIFFGFKREPFNNDLESQHLLKLPSMVAVKGRMDYAASIGGAMLITGDVGSGKSTSIRWSLSQYHSSQYKIIEVTGNGGAITELYRQLCWSVGIMSFTANRTQLIKSFKDAIRDTVKSKKQKVILIIDEAGLLRPEVFSELHIITQFENDSQNMISIVLSGQANLFDKLCYRAAAPLASRIVGRTHITGINKDQMQEYLNHHTAIAGNKNQLFSEPAITAIQQGSGGLLRKANALARGGLIAAAAEKKDVISSEHIRIASTEII